MFTGYMEVGGLEVGNRRRSYELVSQAQVDASWLRLPSDEPTATQLGHGAYSADMRLTPWYDPDVEATERFFGFYPLSVHGIDDSTWTAQITESLDSGGTLSAGRYAARQIRVRGFLTAQGEDALEVGMTWLISRLAPGRCEIHESVCGETDVMWYAAAPRKQRETETGPEYQEYVRDLQRFAHDVKPTSGPLVIKHYRRGNTYGYEVEFTLGCADPHVYTRVVTPNLSTSNASTVLASPFNLVQYPEGVVTSGATVVAKNYITNPSFETNLTGWTFAAIALEGDEPEPYFSASLATDLKVVGTRSAMARLLGNGGTTATGTAVMVATSPEVNTSGMPDGTSMTFSLWCAGIEAAGGTVQSLSATVLWEGGGESYVEAAPSVNGFNFERTILKPSGATSVKMIVEATVVWRSSTTASSNTDVRLYVDAVAATVP